MHFAISYQLAHSRIAGLREDARRGALALAARRARPGRPEHILPGLPPPGGRVRRRPSPGTVLAIASLGSAVAFIDATIVNIAFPDIARSFPSTPISTLSWVLNAYNIVFAAFLIAAAGLADLVGRRRVFVFGLQLFTVGSLLCAIAPSADTLIAMRAVQALGAAFLVPSALGLVLQAFPPDRRSHGVALLSAVGAAAAGLGPSLGGLLTAANWRLVFLVNIPIGVAAALLARRRLAESRAPGRRRLPDLPGTLLFAAAIGALVLGVVKGQEWGWFSARTFGCLAVALAFGVAVIRRCRRHRSPVLDLSLLRSRTFSAANAMMAIGAAGFYGYTLSNVLFLTIVWRYSVIQAGLALTVGPLVAVVVAGPASRLAQRTGPRPVLVAGCLLWSGAVLWFIERVGTTPDFIGQWLPGMVLLGIGAGTAFPNLTGTAVASAPGRSFATATGMNSVARQVGAALGIAVAVAIIGTPRPATAFAVFHHAWTFGAVCLFVAGLGCLLVRPVKAGEAPTVALALASGDGAGDDRARAVLAETGPGGALPAPRQRPGPAAAPVTAHLVARVPESVAEFLARTPLFRGVDPELIGELAMNSRTIHLAAGKWLFRKRDPGDEMFVVRAGRLAVVDEGAVIRECRRGDALGELALLTDSPRSVSARAVRDTEVIAVGGADFTRILHGSPALSTALSQSLGRRLLDARASAPASRPRPATVALIALDGQVPLRRIAEELRAALHAHLEVTLLGAAGASFVAAHGEPAASYGPLLDRAEAAHDLVLLAGGPALAEPWTKFCLQHADRILAVTSGGPVPQVLGRYPELQACDLVAYDAAPGAIAGWAAALDPAASHLIREPDFAADIARMVRRLAGNSVGIVLSGGGARAFAHIGVLEELTAAGVTIDRIAGVSMGAMIGALFAMGHDAEEIDVICFEEWVRRRPLRDFTIPRHALIRGARFQAMLHRTFGTRLIEELPRSFICGSVDLRTRRLEITRHGPLWEAVGFSINLPVIAPPQVRGRKLLVDGSLVSNLPVKPLADMGAGPIIAVDVKAPPERGDSGRDAARARDGRPPSLSETVSRLLLLGSENTTVAARRHADLVIEPRSAGIGLLEFDHLDAAREAGRVAAREALERAPASLFPRPRSGSSQLARAAHHHR